MNRRFYIKQISASGMGKEVSTITFKDGVNILYGPSNSGKSYVINCINFMFAGDIPFERSATGYDTISILFESKDGESVSGTRKIVDGKNGDTGAGNVEVFSTLKDIRSGEYNISKLEYSDLLLLLMGVQERHSIISTQELKSQNLTNRSIFPMFFIDEDYVFRKTTPIDQPKHSKITASISSMKFLIDGDDMNELIPEESKEERTLRLEKNNAVVLYISNKIQQLKDQSGELKDSLIEYSQIDIDNEINTIMEEISVIETSIINASEASKDILKEVYRVSSQLEESLFLKDRYKGLHSQYVSDIKRLQFIIDGDSKKSMHRKPIHCPFCDGNMPEDDGRQSEYIAASEAELLRIKLQLKDLIDVEEDINRKVLGLEEDKRLLDDKNREIVAIINQELKPKVSSLRNELYAFKRAVEAKKELLVIEKVASDLGVDAFDRTLTDDEELKKFDPRTRIDTEVWKNWNLIFDAAVKDCGYPNALAAYIDSGTVDAVVNGKHKKNEGKGYRAFLNTIMLFTLMKFLEENGTYKPGMLILDSPILSLKEKIKVSEQATSGMKESLFKYIIDNCGNNQIIIAENEIPTAPMVDYSSVNMIEFTLDDQNGRYGFLKGYRDEIND